MLDEVGRAQVGFVEDFEPHAAGLREPHRRQFQPQLHDPDWRWMLDCDDSPWYPTMRLFRQWRRAAWAGVLVRVREALERRAER